MSWNICYRGKTELGLLGLKPICDAVEEYEGYKPNVSDSIPLGDDDDIIILSCRDGNNCQKREMDAIASARIPSGEGYLVRIGEHPYNWGRRMILITSETEQGLMHGCMDFVNRYLPKAAQAHQHDLKHDCFINPFKEGFENVVYISGSSVSGCDL